MIHLEGVPNFVRVRMWSHSCAGKMRVNAEWFVSNRLLRRLTIITSLWNVRFTPAGKRSTRMPTIELVIFPSAIAANGVINGWFGWSRNQFLLGPLYDLLHASEYVELTSSQHLARFAILLHVSRRIPRTSLMNVILRWRMGEHLIHHWHQVNWKCWNSAVFVWWE